MLRPAARSPTGRLFRRTRPSSRRRPCKVALAPGHDGLAGRGRGEPEVLRRRRPGRAGRERCGAVRRPEPGRPVVAHPRRAEVGRRAEPGAAGGDVVQECALAVEARRVVDRPGVPGEHIGRGDERRRRGSFRRPGTSPSGRCRRTSRRPPRRCSDPLPRPRPRSSASSSLCRSATPASARSGSSPSRSPPTPSRRGSRRPARARGSCRRPRSHSARRRGTRSRSRCHRWKP